jgi:hypothetical protein
MPREQAWVRFEVCFISTLELIRDLNYFLNFIQKTTFLYGKLKALDYQRCLSLHDLQKSDAVSINIFFTRVGTYEQRGSRFCFVLLVVVLLLGITDIITMLYNRP